MVAKGVSVKFTSYKETIPKTLSLIKLADELKKHDRIVIKPNLLTENKVKVELTEQVLKFCLENKNPESEVFIAEGADGNETEEVFDDSGHTALATKYGVGLIDLNHTETEEVQSPEFLTFEKINYPKILRNSFVISVSNVISNEAIPIGASLYNMIGAFPARHYKGLFSFKKSKLKNIPLKNQIHDILKCKMPSLAVIDHSNQGLLIIGQPLEMDKQAAKVMDIDWRNTYLKLIDESFSEKQNKSQNIDKIIEGS